MQRAMHIFGIVLLFTLLYLREAQATTVTVNDLGDAGPGNCATTCTLRDAIATATNGQTINFGPNLLPGTIALSNGELVIDKPLTIQGPGAAQLAISAHGTSRVINSYWQYDSAAALHINGLTLREGAISIPDSTNGTPGTGQSGGSSATPPLGGCIVAAGMTLVLDGVVVRDCLAVGGRGGDGGSGTTGTGLLTGGKGGAGGSGTEADGGCIYESPGEFLDFEPDLILRDSSLINCQAIGGAAGNGGDGGNGSSASFRGAGGAGGYGGAGLGAAIYFLGKGTLSVRDSTIADSAAIGGSGGNGGIGNPSLVTAPGGDGGRAGDAVGGLIYARNYSFETGNVVELAFATLANGALSPGPGGAGGAGAQQGFSPGPSMFSGSAAIYSPDTTALSTVIVGDAQLPLCGSTITSAGNGLNLDQDSSCGVALNGTFGQLFRPLAASGPVPFYMPKYHSIVIDAAASCEDLDFITLTADEQGTSRPQGSACDLGAIEADYIFVNPFE